MCSRQLLPLCRQLFRRSQLNRPQTKPAKSASGIETNYPSGLPDPAVEALTERLKTLEEIERDTFRQLIEARSKTLDWWFSFLALFTGVIGVLGALVPFLMARQAHHQVEQDRKLIESDKQSVQATCREIEAVKARVEALLADAENDREGIAKLHSDATKDSALLKQFLPPTEILGVDESRAITPLEETIRVAAESVATTANADPLDRLRAEALLAGGANDAEKALNLWTALDSLHAGDPQTVFNIAFWAQKLAEAEHKSGHPVDARRLWELANKRFKQALSIKPDMHAAANSWGIMLATEASTFARSDLLKALQIWDLAGQRFQQAISIKPNNHQAFYNWGVALLAKANALASTDLSEARKHWHQAADCFQQALSILPDKHDAANNWGVVLTTEADALADSNLPEANRLWQQAAELFRQALSIKPDKHTAASNWGEALLSEFSRIRQSHPERAGHLLRQAISLLELHAQRAPGIVAYNLACAYACAGSVSDCVNWLKKAREHAGLPPRIHIETDKNLDDLRNDPQFQQWWTETFNDNGEPMGPRDSVLPD